MRLRVIYTQEQILSVDRPEGAAALSYEHLNLAIADHTQLLPMLEAAGYDTARVREFVSSIENLQP